MSTPTPTPPTKPVATDAPTPPPAAAESAAGKIKAILFDDGSLECKTLEHELKDEKNVPGFEIEIVVTDTQTEDLEKAEKIELDSYLKKAAEVAPKEKGQLTNVWLHFTMEDYNKFNLNDQIAQSSTKYPNIQVIKAYELMWKPALKNNAKIYGLTKEAEAAEKKPPS